MGLKCQPNLLWIDSGNSFAVQKAQIGSISFNILKAKSGPSTWKCMRLNLEGFDVLFSYNNLPQSNSQPQQRKIKPACHFPCSAFSFTIAIYFFFKVMHPNCIDIPLLSNSGLLKNSDSGSEEGLSNLKECIVCSR